MLPDFDESTFTHEKIKHSLFVGGAGPGVVLIHELPGMTPQCIVLARHLVQAGYRVFMPLLFGKVGETNMPRNLMHVCISREFYCFAKNKTSPIVSWLRAVCRHAHEQCGGTSVGVIGMCLTGNFAIALMAEPHVSAPVACQPSLPFVVGKNRKSAIALSPADLQKAQARAAAGQPLLCFRFSEDAISPRERYEAIQRLFGQAFEGMEIDASPGNSHGFSARSHAVLTRDFVDEQGHPTRTALDRVLSFFEERLQN